MKYQSQAKGKAGSHPQTGQVVRRDCHPTHPELQVSILPQAKTPSPA